MPSPGLRAAAAKGHLAAGDVSPHSWVHLPSTQPEELRPSERWVQRTDHQQGLEELLRLLRTVRVLGGTAAQTCRGKKLQADPRKM